MNRKKILVLIHPSSFILPPVSRWSDLVSIVPKAEQMTESSQQHHTGGAHPTERDSTPISHEGTNTGGFPALMVLQPGVHPLPDYELVRKIGSGGFGEVWEALGPGGVPAALKFIRLGEKASETELRSLELMKKIRHPNLISMSGAWQRDGMLIIAMDLGDGTLMNRLQEARSQGFPGIPARELLDYMRDAARGLEFLHQNQIQHRDIKPHNLLIVGGGLKVADFGLAKLLQHQGTTNSGIMTPAYAAPEFFSGQTESQSDQYALAVTYCQLRGGKLPFAGTQAEMITGHLEGAPDLSMLPEGEQPVVARALAKHPAERWANCPDFVAALTPALLSEAGRSEQIPSTVLTVQEEPLPPETGPSSGLFLLLIVLLMLLPATWVVLDLVKPPEPPRLELPTFKALTLFPGQKLLLEVDVGRTHCPGPLELSLEALPREVHAATVPVPAGSTNGTLEVLVHDEAAAGETQVTLQVRGPGEVQAELPFSLTITPPLPPTVQNSIGMELVRVPAGQFTMGSPRTETGRGDDEDEIECFIRAPFYVGIHEVTQKQYEEVMQKNPSLFQQPDLPVEKVTWNDASDFCKKLSEKEKAGGRKYRLPKEVEWEYACRGGAAGRQPFFLGPKLSSVEANFDGRYPYGGAEAGKFLGKTTPVGSYKPPNKLGLHDLCGNVQEWCQDWYFKKANPEGAEKDLNQAGEKSTERVVRGGSWPVGGAACRSAARNKEAPGKATPFTGFRVVMTIEPK